jgi:dethiobiotin synthase
MAQQFFITGTDTGVGKTVLSALLCAGLDASYWKPIQTGASEDSDSRTVATLAELKPENILREAYRFDPPVSPHLAAEMAATRIDMSRIQVPPEARDKTLIVEGAGGVLVPIDETNLMVDLMRQLALPVILATRTKLGTINHTLLSLRALASAQVELAGVVMIGSPNRENREAIEHYGGARVIGEIPHLEKINRASLLEIFSANFDMNMFRRVSISASAAMEKAR